MIEKIKAYTSKFTPKTLTDLGTVGPLIFLVIVLLVSWSGIKAIQTNYNLQKQIAVLKQQDQVQQLENSNLNLQNQYYNSNQYLELMARQDFGLGQPGEKELIVPKNIALAHITPHNSSGKSSNQSATHQSRYAANFQAWIDFLLHRQNNTAN